MHNEINFCFVLFKWEVLNIISALRLYSSTTGAEMCQLVATAFVLVAAVLIYLV